MYEYVFSKRPKGDDLHNDEFICELIRNFPYYKLF